MLQPAGVQAFQKLLVQQFLQPGTAQPTGDVGTADPAEAAAEGQREGAVDLLCTLGRLEACSDATRLAIIRCLTTHALFVPTEGSDQQVCALSVPCTSANCTGSSGWQRVACLTHAALPRPAGTRLAS